MFDRLHTSEYKLGANWIPTGLNNWFTPGTHWIALGTYKRSILIYCIWNLVRGVRYVGVKPSLSVQESLARAQETRHDPGTFSSTEEYTGYPHEKNWIILYEEPSAWHALCGSHAFTLSTRVTCPCARNKTWPPGLFQLLKNMLDTPMRKIGYIFKGNLMHSMW